MLKDEVPDSLKEIGNLAAQIVAKVVALESPDLFPRLVTLDYAAELLSVSRTTMQEIVDRGEIAVVEVTGRAVRVDVRDIEAFLTMKRTRRG